MTKPTPSILSDYTALADFGRTLEEIFEVARSIKAWVEANREPIGQFIDWAGNAWARSNSMEESGWLPHYTQPNDLFPPLVDASTAHTILDRHYRERWADVEAQMLQRVASYPWDAEAKACFREALSAHAAGFYRTAPRLLFPEIERLMHARLSNPAEPDNEVTSRDLRNKAEFLGPSNFMRSGVLSIRIYEKFAQHLYARVKTAEQIAAAQSDPVPNRHAALHGVVVYSSMQSSLNALIMAEFAMLTIEAVAEADREAQGFDAGSPLLAGPAQKGSQASPSPSPSCDGE